MPHPLRILIVEDNPGDAELLELQLPEDGSVQEVVCVPRLAQALALVSEREIDLVFLDLSLPDSWGLETLRQLHRQAGKIPVIVLTGNSDEETGLAAIREGAQDYLVKGETDTRQLTRSIKYAVERNRAENALRMMNDTLEQRVAERTGELIRANEALRVEIAERQHAEEEQHASAQRLAAMLDAQREIAANLDDNSLLQLILEIMSRLTAADGASLELSEGDEMVYEAATGMAAGFIGLRLKTAGSLSGRCLTSGVLQRSDDTESDPRVDRAACRRIGLRSILVIPLRYDEHSFGVLKLMSARVGAFDTAAEHMLRLMGEFLGVTVARQRTQAAFMESEERFRVAQELSPDGFTILRPLRDELGRVVDFVWIYQNAAIGRLTGTEPQAVVGRRLLEVNPGHAGTPFQRAYQQVAETGHSVVLEAGYQGEEMPQQKWFRVAVVPIGRDIAVLAQDITEHKKAEVALKQVNEELEKRVVERTAQLRERDQILLLQSRQAAMGEMIGNIAHQWRQPLNALGMLVQEVPMVYEFGELDRRYVETTAERSMAIIRHMSRTIDDFRNFFRPDKEKVYFHVREEVEKTLSLIEAGFRAYEIAVEVRGEGDPVVHGYPNEYSQVLMNILLNARDALVERRVAPPRVWIEIGERAVTVCDNAGGIPEEIIDKIFDPYFTTKGPQLGTGVGLFMSKNIIEKNMGGRLSVCNVGEGACFRIEVSCQ